MEDTDTDTLRKLAPCWNLAGDETLLTILQNTHQRLVAKCQETNSQLEQMASALDDANISLQNVNNRFMALSSSQFVERRVYDDDVDVTVEPPAVTETPKLLPPDELSILKRSIAVIEKTHEVITILQDSDTESDTDDEIPDRLVMKPKDMYADRPLPYIIGSEPWKSKWHAGLMLEDSDTDSSTSKVERESDQYSQSEPEDFDLVNSSKEQDIPEHQHVRKVSETSSDVTSEPTPGTKLTPADVASELARRLGGGDPPPRVVEEEPEYEDTPKPVVRKVYKPQEPVATTIFPDEPPPLEEQSDSDADIFAELHRKQPYSQPYSSHHVADQLFGGDDTENEQGGDIFSDFANQPTTKPVSLFEAGPTPHMFDKQRDVGVTGVGRTPQKNAQAMERSVEQSSAAATEDVKSVKKPIGGISLFGSNKGAENIGAAILKRNRRKSYTSSEESSSETPSHKSPIRDEKEKQAKTEKDIFEDLFAKSETKKVTPKRNIEKYIKQDIPKQKEEIQKKDTPKPIDLFSDNLFDDIDDIFTTNVVKDSKDKSKSIFEDDDDLFSEVADKNTAVHQNPKNKNENKKGLFDSDDDLFSEDGPKNKRSIGTKPQSATKIITNPVKVNEPSKISEISSKNIQKAAVSTPIPNITKGKSSIFDDDSDENDIFSTAKSNIENSKAQHSSSTGAVSKNIDTSKNVFKSPSLFDDDDGGDLFTDRNKTQKTIQHNVTDKELTSSIKPEKIVNITEKDVDRENKSSVEASNEQEIEKDEFYKNKPADVNKILDETPSKTKTKMTDSNLVKSVDHRKEIDHDDKFKQKEIIKTDVFEEPKPITNVLAEDTVTETEDNTGEEKSNFEDNNDDYLSNVIESAKSANTENFNINSEATEVQKVNVGIISSNNLNENEFNNKYVEETINESTKKNTTEVINEFDKSKPKINIHETLIQSDIFDDSLSEKDIFSSPNNIPSFEEPHTTSSTDKTEDVNIIPNADIFTDIISEPPDFEKPKEPKKSKNVNALFDDDSDDETLFFKRDDVITDEKPEDFTAKQDRLFDMFTNEPPDEDFTNINDDLDDDLFSTMPKPRLPSEQVAPHNIGNDNYNESTVNDLPNVSKEGETETPPNISHSKENTDDLIASNSEIIKSGPFSKGVGIFNDHENRFSSVSNKSEKLLSDDNDDDELFKSLPTQLPETNIEFKSRNDDELDEPFMSLPPNLDKEISNEFRKPPLNFKLPSEPSDSNSRSEVKKVGKLKLGLNINVNALLPGASPKKIKQVQVDNIDGQAQSQVEIPKAEPISFEGEPEPKILDSKLSKERPRIQVKRRPSTRKARIEAVRKSGIDFGDDSTDNSSSIDDTPKKEIQSDFEITEKNSNNDIEQSPTEDISREEKYEEKQEIQIENTETDNQNIKNEIPIDISEVNEDKTDILDSQPIIETSRPPLKSDSTTKIVYILNDEDIFNTTTIEDPLNKTNLTNESKEKYHKNTESVDSSMADSNLNSNSNSEPGIKTLGKAYQSTKSDENKKSKSLFGEDQESDDEEIFRNKKPAVKSTVFDSDSEGELFGAAKKVDNVKTVEKVIKEVKGSLFGDDDDDDDLFGVKTSKPAESQQSTKSSSVKETPKQTEPVFEDPLSMFGDD